MAGCGGVWLAPGLGRPPHGASRPIANRRYHMSTITFTCYACNQVLKVGGDKAGKKAKCIKCGTILTIPAATEEEIAPEPPRGSAPAGRGRDSAFEEDEPAPRRSRPRDDEDDAPRRRPRDDDEDDGPRRKR